MSYYEATLLEEHILIAVDELERASGLSIEQITELVEYGVFQPQGGRPHEWRFTARCIALGRRANRLSVHGIDESEVDQLESAFLASRAGMERTEGASRRSNSFVVA